MKHLEFRFHEVDEIADGVYRVDECKGLCYFYIVVGEEKCLLIDNGNGAGDITEIIKAITDLPVECVLTHHHCDHAGGSGWFPYVYCHEADFLKMYYDYSDDQACKWWAKITHRDFEIYEKPYEKKLVPIEDGHVFDLGGRKITTYLVPGHTFGSLVFTDDKSKILFVGDNVGTQMLMSVPGQTSLEKYLPSLYKMNELAEEYTPWWGHLGGVMDKSHIETLIKTVKEVMAKYDKNSEEENEIWYPSKKDLILRYNTNNIFEK